MAYVLVVDDDDTVAAVVLSYLERAGYSTRHVGDGPAAVESVRDKLPDLVVLDVMLPGFDGLEVCRRVHAQHPQLPIVMLTALAEPDDRQAGGRRGRLPDQAVLTPRARPAGGLGAAPGQRTVRAGDAAGAGRR